jgi:hypothetical protein
MTLLHIDASFAITPRATPKSKPNSDPGFEAQNHKPSTSGFQAKPANLAGDLYRLRLLHDINACHRDEDMPTMPKIMAQSFKVQLQTQIVSEIYLKKSAIEYMYLYVRNQLHLATCNTQKF